MWTKIENNCVQWKAAGRTEIYNESALRRTFIGFLSNESRNRFSGENFCADEMFYDTCEWFMKGLRLFFEN